MTVLFFAMSYLPPIGHFNFARIGHYYFAVTDLIVDENDKAIAQGGLLPDSVVAYWGPNTGNVNNAVSSALERVFLGDQNVEDAFAQAQEEAQTALSE